MITLWEERLERLRSFGQHAYGLLATTRHGMFVVDAEDGGVSAKLLMEGAWEADLYDRMTPLVSRSGTVMVVGAHVGAHAIPLSYRCQRLIAIEPNPHTFSFLKANVLLNECRNVELHNVAANDMRTRLRFIANRANSGGSKREPVRMRAEYVYDDPGIIEVDAVPLDEIVQCPLGVDLILMDIEGSEVFALRGMKNLLSGTKALCIEFFSDHLVNVAGVTVDAFTDELLPHFSWMRNPGSDDLIPRDGIRDRLRSMYKAGESSEGLFFFRDRPKVDVARLVDSSYCGLAPIFDSVLPEKVSVKELCEAARCHVEAGETSRAEACYDVILKNTDPVKTGVERIARGEACRFFADRALRAAELGGACDWFHKALVADPLWVECRLDLINKTLIPLGWLELARQEAARAALMEPENSMVWQVAAYVECEANDAVEARRFIDKALEVGPQNAGAHLIAGKLDADTARWDEAVAHYQTAYDLADHRKAEALHGIAIVRDRQGRTAEAVELMDQALALTGHVDGRDDDQLMRWNRSEMLLTLGEYGEGWPEHNLQFDQNYRGKEFVAVGRQLSRRFKVPLLALDDPPCRVHVHPEMGFGDVLCMSRYVPMLQAMGHDVRLEVKSHMVDLFATSFPGVKVVEFAVDYPGGIGLPLPFDRHVHLMAFPAIFGTTIDTIPWSGPYLRADPAMVDEAYRRYFSGHKHGLKVGICVTSGIRDGIWMREYGKRKSILNKGVLSPLFGVDGVTWHHFEFEKISYPPAPSERGVTFGETAAEIANLDLVITVDSAVAHLAGAMGKPVWLMMHCGGSWHHMRPQAWGGRCESESPWYPSTRIFRADKPHEWGKVIERIVFALNEVSCK